MFAQVYQPGLVSLLYSIGNKPLQLWEKHEETPARSIVRVLDDDVQSSVIELSARESIANTWIRCPAAAAAADSTANDRQSSLHLRLPHLVLLLKSLPCDDTNSDSPDSIQSTRELSIEVHVRDARQQLRRFRASSFQCTTVVHPLLTLLPLHLDAGCWNQLRFDLAQLTRDAYNATFAHVVSVQLHANCRVRRIYLADAVVAEEQLPVELRLYKRLSKSQSAAYKALDESESASERT